MPVQKRPKTIIGERRSHRLPVLLALLALTAAFADVSSANASYYFDSQVGGAGFAEGQFWYATGVATASGGDVYVADSAARIQKFDSDGTFIKMWGWGVADGSNAFQFCTSGCQAGIPGSGDGQLDNPYGIAVDSNDDVYVAEAVNLRIQKFDSDGNFIAAWGWGVADGSSAYQICTSGCQAGIAGWGDGQFTNARGLAIDPNDDVYVIDASSYRIQKFDSNGNFLAAMGWGVDDGSSAYQVCTSGCQVGLYGSGDGQMGYLADYIAADSSGNVYVTDGNTRVQKFDASGNFVTKWGSSGTGAGQFGGPAGIGTDAAGNVYVADTANHRVSKFDPSGNFLLMWGYGVADGANGFQLCQSSCQSGLYGNGTGQFSWPTALAVDRSGTVIVHNHGGQHLQLKFRSRYQYPAGIWTAGKGSLDGQFKNPRSIAIDAAGNVYVADTSNRRIQKFDANGTFLLMWGWGVDDGTKVFQTCTSGCQAGVAGSGDGQFKNPRGVGTDPAGNVYVADTSNHRVQKFDPSGTFLGKWGIKGSLEGQFKNPYSVAADAFGNVYVADTSNRRIQKFDTSGTFVLTFGWGVDDGTKTFQTCSSGCQAGVSGSGEGQLKNPRGVTVDAGGAPHVADTGNGRVQVFERTGTYEYTLGTKGTAPGQLKNPQDLTVDPLGYLLVIDTSNNRVHRFF